MTKTNHAGASALWIMLLTVASIATTLVLGCATPFPSLAAVAALHMQRRDGIILMLATWAASQAVGFCVLNYPHTAMTLTWAAALGTAAVGSAIAADALLPRFARAPLLARMVIAYLAAFAAFKVVMLCWALGLGEAHATIAPPVVMKQFVRNAAIFAGLYLAYRVLIALGVPAARRRSITA